MAVARPLLLLTRPEPASLAFWRSLSVSARDSADFLINPLIQIEPHGPLPSLDGVKGLIFTSANGLHAYRALGGKVVTVPAIAVGENTAFALEAFGFETIVAPGTAAQLVEFVIEKGYQGPLLHLRGAVSVGDVAQSLTSAGVMTKEAVLYDQRLLPLKGEIKEALSQDRQVIAPVFSPRTARQLLSESSELRALHVAAISQSVAQSFAEDTLADVRIADTPNRSGMVALVEDMIAKVAMLE